MNLKTFIKVNPVRFWLTTLGWILSAVFTIFSTYLVQTETNILLSRNWTPFILINIASLLLLLITYSISSLVDYGQEAQTQDLDNYIRSKIVSHYYHDGKNYAVAQMQNRLTNDLKIANENYFNTRGAS